MATETQSTTAAGGSLNTNYFTQGYTCSLCGTYVQPGTAHMCQNYNPNYPPHIPQITYTVIPDNLQEVLLKLDELTKAVNRLIEKLDKSQ